MINWEQLLNSIISWSTNTGIRIVIALVLLYVSFKLINLVGKKLEKKSSRIQKLDKTLTTTLIYIGKIVCKALVIICLIGYLGIDTSGLTALVASLGVCAGLAVNGTLSNFAGGVLLLITRPFNIDDFVQIGEHCGTVEDIRIVNTKLITPDQKTIFIPNSIASTTSIVNYTATGIRRVDLTYSISYSADFRKAEEILMSIMNSHPKVLKDPQPTARLLSHSESSLELCCRPWVNSSDYWDVYFDINESVKQEFDKAGIEIPFKQIDVHMKD